MAWGQKGRCCLCRGVVLTWLLLAMFEVHVGHSLTTDQIISRCMKKSMVPGPDGLLYDDDQHRTVRVGLDMLFDVDEWAELVRMSSNGSQERHKRQAIAESARRRYWPDGVIYYEIVRSHFRRRDIKHLYSAMEEWMRYTCVQFLPAPPRTHNKIVFTDGHYASGCASHVGMRGGPQKVSLPRGCRAKGVVMHELGHVLGFNHEQTRPDRDRYVTIRWENIPSYMTYNFRKFPWAVVRDLGVPYDYLSIMHYGKDAFSGNGQMTIQTRDPRYQQIIGNRRGLSFRDIKSTNILYNCTPSSDRCTLRDEDCPGEGFVSKHCTCWCPTKDIITHIFIPYHECRPTTSDSQRGRDSSTEGVSDHSSSTEAAGRSEDCEDQNEHCQMWAERGECQNNPEYMNISCRKACALCNTVEPACRDDFETCEFWRERGYCTKSTVLGIFIRNNCKQTCGVCKTAPGPGKTGKTLACERQCQDQDEQCREWAARGECTATSDYMLRYCRKTCHACCT